MAKHHQSFVIRCWQLERGEQRIDIEHIQSGDRWLARSPVEALEWICGRLGGTPTTLPRGPDESEERSAESGETT